MYDRKAFKREAKELMRESTPHYMLVVLVYILLTTGLSYLVTFLTSAAGIAENVIGMFLNLLIALFSMVMSMGLVHYSLNLARKQPTSVKDLFEGFTFAGRTIGLNILVAIYTFLWALLPIIGAGVLIGVLIALAAELEGLMAILAVVIYLVAMVFVVALVLRYAMAQYALAENPDDGVSAAIRRSVQMMKGNKGKFFVLELSFIGWGLLCALIVLAVMAVGVLVSGVDWFVGMFQSLETDPWAAYNATMELTGNLSIWTIIAEVVCLPLTLWLTAYQQTAFARFYNYVSGYDYHQYMNEGHEEVVAESALPETVHEERPAPPTPPGGFYTPAPKLDESVEVEAEEPVEQVVEELEEVLEVMDEEETEEE